MKQLLREALAAITEDVTRDAIVATVRKLRAAIDALGQEPFGWAKSSEIEQSQKFGGSINVWRKKYDCDVPLFANPRSVADLTDDEIVKIAMTSRGAEAGRDGYILPITFGRAVLDAQKLK